MGERSFRYNIGLLFAEPEDKNYAYVLRGRANILPHLLDFHGYGEGDYKIKSFDENGVPKSELEVCTKPLTPYMIDTLRQAGIELTSIPNESILIIPRKR